MRTQFIVRTWTAGESDLQEDAFATEAMAREFAKDSRLNGYETEVVERQPDLFQGAA